VCSWYSGNWLLFMYITSNIGPRACKHDSRDKGIFVTEHDYRLHFLLLQEDFVKCFFLVISIIA
jgi:hypothetical protein